MKKDVLKKIKDDMKQVYNSKEKMEAEIKARIEHLKLERKAALAKVKNSGRKTQEVNKHFEKIAKDAVDEIFSQYHCNQFYYLIYKGGYTVPITAKDILCDYEPFPKLTGIVYAEMSSDTEWVDTEAGKLDWFSDERMAACGWNHDAAEAARERYDTAIGFAFGADWTRVRQEIFPEHKFTPLTLEAAIALATSPAAEKAETVTQTKTVTRVCRKARCYSGQDRR